MTAQLKEYSALLPDCCQLAAVRVADFTSPERALLAEFLPAAKTVLVLAHHVTASLEWAWFPFAAERQGNTCAADLHAKAVIEKIAARLRDQSFAVAILPYPGRCGVNFKYIAARSALGSLGVNRLFLHREWGPWAHLRVLLTDAAIAAGGAAPAAPCDGCGACIAACPSGAITADSFTGAVCGEYMQAGRDKYGVEGAFRWKCEICARACPRGGQPQPVQIKAP